MVIFVRKLTWRVWCTILLLSAYTKSVACSRQVFPTLNKSFFWGSSVLHIFNWTVECSYVEINGKVHHTYTHIYIYIYNHDKKLTSPVGLGYGIHQLHLCGGVRHPPPNECLGYDFKPSDSEAPYLKRWEMWSTPSLLLLPGPLWLGAVASDRVTSIVAVTSDNKTSCISHEENFCY